MNKINIKILLSLSVGIIMGAFFLAINLVFSSFENTGVASSNVEEQVFILTESNSNTDDLLKPLLVMLGFNTDLLNIADEESLLVELDDISVRIVAQSSVGGRLHTLLEIITPKETKRIVVTEGSTVNGFLIKSINNNQLIIERNSEEHTIELFHLKEINHNRIKNDLK